MIALDEGLLSGAEDEEFHQVIHHLVVVLKYQPATIY